MNAPAPPILQAIEALKKGERRQAAALIEQELRNGPPPGDRWRSVSRLAAEIGEIDMAIESARRAIEPMTLQRLLFYWGTLATYGRSQQALDEAESLPEQVRGHRAVLHFRGTIASENGRFAEAEELFRRALAQEPDAFETWFALSMIKTFEPDDPDLETMESLAARTDRATPTARSQLYYALGKAWDDCGEPDRAFGFYEQGAALRRSATPYDSQAARVAAERVMQDFTPAKLRDLAPSGMGEQRSIFVTGLPRSGTTLVQQILAAHSRVSDGDEVNLFKPALLPTLDFSLAGALAYQRRTNSGDPWGDVARDYGRFIDMRFRSPGLIVDKSLGQSAQIALLLHSLPHAKIVWLRRRSEDAALSCFRTSFTASTHWSWSVEDIASHFRIEDQLFDHWMGIYADRILPVPYEDLVHEPDKWTATIADHVGLDVEEGMRRFHEGKRTVRTASVKQVRSPVSTQRVGVADRYGPFVERFRAAYYG